MDKKAVLRSISFGQRIAEDEADALASYFVATDDWSRLYSGSIDIIYGPKGAGKSALYALLLSKTEDLFNLGILPVDAENPRGTPAFSNLLTTPPASEREFVGLWKLYIASLLHSVIDDYALTCDAAKQLENALAQEGLIKGTLSLSGLLQGVVSYVSRIFNPQAIELGVGLDPASGLPSGMSGKIVFSEPGAGAAADVISVDRLLALANTALAKNDMSAWVLLDRLDVAFSEHEELEANALRALFRVYLDLAGLDSIKLKIFLRSDIWARITNKGFREASHITRHLTIAWDRNSLLNLIVRRCAHNQAVLDEFGIQTTITSDSASDQEAFFYRMFPDQVEVGPNKSKTLEWILARTRDGSKLNAPRELIHFLNSLRETQVKRYEQGETEPKEEVLFERASFKAALPQVSEVRLNQTLFAEHPSLKQLIEKLKGAKSAHSPESLSVIWEVDKEQASTLAESMAAVGFFEIRGSREKPEYWVPFLYRDSLGLVQGTAE